MRARLGGARGGGQRALNECGQRMRTVSTVQKPCCASHCVSCASAGPRNAGSALRHADSCANTCALPMSAG